MEEKSIKRVKILEVMRYLEQESDDRHAVSVSDIIDALKAVGLDSERKSIYAYIQQLEDYGLDIITTRDSANLYHIGNRTFQLAELKLLVDAVQFSKFITKEKSQELIEKLKTLTSIHEALLLSRDDVVTDRLKTKNQTIYLNVDAIHEAILSQRRLKFRYFEYGLDKSMHFRKNGDFYTMVPEVLCWDDEKYYCIMYHENRHTRVVFRVDKMRDVSVTESKHSHVRNQEDLERYFSGLFSMFGGEAKRVKLQFDQDLAGVVFDRFGLDTPLTPTSDGRFTIEEEVLISQTFLSWLFQFEDKAKILGPQEVIDAAKTMLQKTLSNYD